MATTVAELQAIITADTRGLDNGLSKSQSQLKAFGTDLTRLGVGLSASVTAPLALMGKAAVEAGSSFESAFAGVRKTVDATEPELAKMREGFRQMAREIPITANEMAKIGEAAGALGVKKSDILAFTRTMADLGVATNLTSDQAATGLARLANIIKNDAGPQFDRLGATLVALGNAGASTEQEILEMSLRIAGAGKQAGLSEADILGFANALSSVGIEAEAGGSSISRVFTKMADATKMGGKELQIFAQVAGQSAADFKKAFETDAAGATISFIEGLGKIAASGQSLTPILEQLELSDIRVSDALKRAAGSGDLFRESIELGSKAWADNSALTKEATERYKTFDSQVQIFKNTLTDVGITLFDTFRPALMSIVDGLKSLVDNLTPTVKAFAEAHPEITKAGLAFVALAAVSGPVLLALGAISTAIASLSVPLVAGVAAVSALAVAYATDFEGIRTLVNSIVADLVKLYQDHKTEIDLLAQGVGVALTLMAKFWAEQVKEILESIRLLTLALRVMAGDYEAAWELMKESGKQRQQEIIKDNSTFTLIIKSAVLVLTKDLDKIWKLFADLLSATWDSIKAQATNAWNAIGTAIIKPIQDALNWIKSKIGDFQAAFAAITAAAKAGLVVKSPPIAAQWVEMIGQSAIKSAAMTASAAPKFNEAFSAITAFAREHLPKAVSTIIDLGGTVIKVLEDLGVKLPKVLGDIFGKAGTGAGATAAGKAGGILGQQFVEKFSLALEGAKGVLAAGSAPNRVSGAISGGLSGAISGALIGSIFGPVGTVVGLIAGGLAGVIGGIWRSPLQKAQEAAALQEAKDAIQLSMQRVLKGAQEVIQSATESFMKALEFFEKLDEFSAVRKAKFQEFWKAMTRLMNGFFELAKQFVGQSMPQLKAVAETIKPIAEAIAMLPAAFDAISGHFGIAQSSIDNFFASFSKIMDAFFERSEIWIDGISKRAMKVANRLSPVVQLISAFGQALTDISGVKEPGDEIFAIFSRVIDKIVDAVANLSLKFDKAVLKTMANFAEKAGAALSIWKEAIESIKATVDIQAPSEASVDNVVAGIELFINKLAGAVERMVTTDLARITAFANVVTPIAGAIKAWAETAEVIRGYTAVAAEVWDQIVTDFERGLVLLNLLILDAQLYVEKATLFKSLIDQGAGLVEAALGAFGASISSAASALTGGLPQGGEAIGTSVSSQAAMSLGPSTSSRASAQTVVNVTVQGTVIESVKLADAIRGVLVSEGRRGTISLGVVTA